jgi:hypothetical protein
MFAVACIVASGRLRAAWMGWGVGRLLSEAVSAGWGRDRRGRPVIDLWIGALTPVATITSSGVFGTVSLINININHTNRHTLASLTQLYHVDIIYGDTLVLQLAQDI